LPGERGVDPVTEISRKEMFDVLNDFYTKILEPRFDSIEKKLDGHDQKFDDLTRHLDQIYSRFERLEMEYHAINGAIDRLDETYRED
jgi:archaellum component FlaC